MATNIISSIRHLFLRLETQRLAFHGSQARVKPGPREIAATQRLDLIQAKPWQADEPLLSASIRCGLPQRRFPQGKLHQAYASGSENGTPCARTKAQAGKSSQKIPSLGSCIEGRTPSQRRTRGWQALSWVDPFVTHKLRRGVSASRRLTIRPWVDIFVAQKLRPSSGAASGVAWGGWRRQMRWTICSCESGWPTGRIRYEAFGPHPSRMI